MSRIVNGGVRLFAAKGSMSVSPDPCPLVISGPSGVGKSTLLKRLFAKYPNAFGFSVSHTTRGPRPGEVDGVAYNFVTRERFHELLAENAFIENTEFSGNLYGTSFETVKKVQDQGKICVLDVEMAGVKAIKNTILGAKFVFVRPPSIQDLETRLRGRGTETEESLAKRLGAAQGEMDFADTGVHDKIIINGESEDAAFQLSVNFHSCFDSPPSYRVRNSQRS
ncbi:P-loop containing nucleoside triphosphate hydrolase protein [Chytriomyces sp. MP71]|nr:P-loop containing nucleoside triphosphate hydrolase protein [Chytriomyces sp. MP71]